MQNSGFLMMRLKQHRCRSAQHQCSLIIAFIVHILDNMSCFMRKQAFCLCLNKDADQLRCNRAADQRLCFRYIIRISSLWSNSVDVQHGLCRTWSETPRTGFLIKWLENKGVDQLHGNCAAELRICFSICKKQVLS